MAFGSNNFPLGPNGQFPRQRIRSYGNVIAAPSRVEDIYAGRDDVKLPVTEKDFHSSVSRPKSAMKKGVPHINADPFGDIDKYRPRYAQLKSLRQYDSAPQDPTMTPDNSWLKRSTQRFPGLQDRGENQNISPMNVSPSGAIVDDSVIVPATGISGVGYFGRKGSLGDVEQKYAEDRGQSRMNGVNYFRRPYR